MSFTVAIIGCGKRSPMFVEAMLAADNTKFIAAVDPFAEGREKIVEQFGGTAYESVDAMLAAQIPDFVCMVTRPNVRLEPITACAQAGVKGFHSEKPTGVSIGVARASHAVATENGMKLTYSHQRRFNANFSKAKTLIEEGAIGELQHFDTSCDNLYDWGTHWFDMMHYLNNEEPVEWILAQAERSDPKMVFDQPMDRCGISVAHFANGVIGTMHTGEAQPAHNGFRIAGSEGQIVIDRCDHPELDLWTASGKETLDLKPEGETHQKHLVMATIDAIDCVREGRESRLSSRFALAATECIFASYASAMRGGKVVLPLDGDLSLAEIFS